MKLFLRSISIVLLLFGIIGWGLGISSAIGVRWITPKTELPVSQPGCIAVGHNREIYLGLDFYYRIQVYSNEGKFIREWPYQPGCLPIRMRINAAGQLEVANPMKLRSGDKPDVLTTFNVNGDIVSSQVKDNCYAEFGNLSELRGLEDNHEFLEIKSRYIYPHIIRRDASGSLSTVIGNPWYLWFILGPLQSFACYVIGLIILNFKRIKNGKKIMKSDR